jgi:hypothetical protein
LSDTVNIRTLRVNDDTCEQEQEVSVLENLILNGNLRVNCNEKADVKDNKVRVGDITCRDNDRLDSFGNVAEGGSVAAAGRRELALEDLAGCGPPLEAVG